MKKLLILFLISFFFISFSLENSFEKKFLQKKYKWYSDLIYENSKKYCKVPVLLTFAIIQVESSGNPRALGKLVEVRLIRNNKYVYEYHRAYGLMQVMGFHSKNPKSLFNIPTNIKYGCKILNECLYKYKYLYKTISCYNVGINNKYLNKKYLKKVKRELL